MAARLPPTVDMKGMDPEVAEAITQARKTVIAQPRSPEAWGHLGAVFRAHELPPASACFNEAMRLDPTDYRWPYLMGVGLYSRFPDIALPLLVRAAGLCGDEAAPNLRLGEILLDKGEMDNAEALFKKGLEKGQMNASRANLGLGRIALERNDVGRAVELLRLAVSAVPRAKDAHVALAQAYRRQGNLAAAEEEQQKAALLKTQDTGWPDPCAEFVDQAWVGMRARMSRIAGMDMRGEREEAIVASRQTVARYPESPVARLVLGEMLNKSRSFPAAEASLRESIRLDPEKSKAHFELGYALHSQGKVAEAVASYRKALEKQADYAPAYFNMALGLQALKDDPGALEALQAAIRHRPEYLDAHIALSAMLERLGNVKESREHAEEAARLAPSDPRPKKLLEDLKAKAAKQ